MAPFLHVEAATLKHKLLLAATALITAGALGAQEAPRRGTPPTPEQMATRRVAQFDYILNLTDAQEAQAKTIFTEEATAMQAVHPQVRAAREALQNAVKNTGLDTDIERAATQLGTLQAQTTAIAGKAQAKFRAILTPEQKTKLDSRPGFGPGGPGGFGGPGHMRRGPRGE
jgi:Spy/CpxP family protein refolding chaperone